MKLITYTLLLVLFLGSCTIEKRLYNRGYYVEFRQNPVKKSGKEVEKIPAEVKTTVEENHALLLTEPAELTKREAVVTLPKASIRLRESEFTAKSETKENEVVPIRKKVIAAEKQPDRTRQTTFHSSKKVKSQQPSLKKAKSSSRNEGMSEEAFEFLVGAIIVVILLFSMVFPTFWAVVQLIAAIVMLGITLFCIIWVIVWLCKADFGNFPWFWSGR